MKRGFPRAAPALLLLRVCQFHPRQAFRYRASHQAGTDEQFRGDYALTPHISLALETVHFAIGDALRAVGAHDSNYVGAETRFAW